MRVQVTHPALVQLVRILDDLREKNPRAADRLAARIRKARAEISAHPDLGRRQDVEGVRKKVIQPGGYLIFYAVDQAEDVANILAVLHPRRARPYQDA